MPTKLLKVAAYQLHVHNPETPVSFASILTTLNEVPNDERRTMFAADEPVRLRRLQAVGPRWLGDLARIRLHELIAKSTTNGVEGELEFADNEGPCEKTAFFFDPATAVMMIQQTAGAVSASSCGRYFRTLGHVQKIEIVPVMKIEALERILRMENVRKFQIKLAGIDSAQPLRANTHASARSLMEFLRAVRAPTASISVAIDRETPRLERIASLIRDALQWEESGLAQVKKILVVGSEDEAGPDEIVAIDLLRDRIVETVPVELPDGQRIGDNDRYNAVRTAWNRVRVEMEQRPRQ
jgi:hypothetical protein